MFVDYWCEKCGESIASNLYKTKEERWTNDKWKEHWKQRIEEAKKIHICKL